MIARACDACGGCDQNENKFDSAKLYTIARRKTLSISVRVFAATAHFAFFVCRSTTTNGYFRFINATALWKQHNDALYQYGEVPRLSVISTQNRMHMRSDQRTVYRVEAPIILHQSRWSQHIENSTRMIFTIVTLLLLMWSKCIFFQLLFKKKLLTKNHQFTDWFQMYLRDDVFFSVSMKLKYSKNTSYNMCWY